ncbi:uncharacterized protein A4U43_C01F32220 [Asparagus officinalis]|uniref:DUF1639 family protein n=1 Tax=Asparagus officinalis TaxID=4686 RepID=A0A5P1FUF3_ASPOF|nr:uncharacterized protein A4U43_C01F32220 [Asparagus officinalis]
MKRVLRCVNLTAEGNVTATNNKSSSESDPKPKLKRVEEEAESSSPARPWNLRTRRANPNRISNQNASPSPNLKRSSPSPPSPPSPTILAVEGGNLVKLGRSEEEERNRGERCKFSVALKREEIEEDFVKMKGSKPPRRPKKRAKYVQRQLDSLFPGLWLSEITADLYKIDVEKT